MDLAEQIETLSTNVDKIQNQVSQLYELAANTLNSVNNGNDVSNIDVSFLADQVNALITIQSLQLILLAALISGIVILVLALTVR